MVFRRVFEQGYLIQLANGQCWRIVGGEGINSWVEEVAFMMTLEKCVPNGCPNLILIERTQDETYGRKPLCHLNLNIQRSLPSAGWTFRNLVWLKIWSHREVQDIVCELGMQDGSEMDVLKMRMAIGPVYKMAQALGGFPLHAALVERNELGFLLAASGGTGKSTCCNRLQASWKPLCDDETLIVKDAQNQYLAHPFPTWSDYLTDRLEWSWDTQRHLPLSAIFFLEQAEADSVVSIGQGQAAIMVYQLALQVCRWNMMDLYREEVGNFKKELFENACVFTKSIPAFKLRVSLNGRFWEKMDEVLH